MPSCLVKHVDDGVAMYFNGLLACIALYRIAAVAKLRRLLVPEGTFCPASPFYVAGENRWGPGTHCMTLGALLSTCECVLA